MGISIGCLCDMLSALSADWDLRFMVINSDIIFGALAVGISTFIMVITNTEHAPAAGLALGFVLNQWTWETILVVFWGIIGVSLIKTAMKPILIDLV